MVTGVAYNMTKDPMYRGWMNVCDHTQETCPSLAGGLACACCGHPKAWHKAKPISVQEIGSTTEKIMQTVVESDGVTKVDTLTGDKLPGAQHELRSFINAWREKYNLRPSEVTTHILNAACSYIPDVIDQDLDKRLRQFVNDWNDEGTP
jgi:hypothetical protein